MPEYRRWRVHGASYFFFTVVTVAAGRRPILAMPAGRAALRRAIADVRLGRPFERWCVVLLPDHLHCIRNLPPGDDDYPIRWSMVKRRFSQLWRDSGGATARRSASRVKKRELGVWQRRYWEHLIRDERELLACRDYIHMNPVKHGYVRDPHDWPWSSVHRHLRNGWLAADWTGASAVDVTVVGEV